MNTTVNGIITVITILKDYLILKPSSGLKISMEYSTFRSEDDIPFKNTYLSGGVLLAIMTSLAFP